MYVQFASNALGVLKASANQICQVCLYFLLTENSNISLRPLTCLLKVSICWNNYLLDLSQDKKKNLLYIIYLARSPQTIWYWILEYFCIIFGCVEINKGDICVAWFKNHYRPTMNIYLKDKKSLKHLILASREFLYFTWTYPRTIFSTTLVLRVTSLIHGILKYFQ